MQIIMSTAAIIVGIWLMLIVVAHEGAIHGLITILTLIILFCIAGGIGEINYSLHRIINNLEAGNRYRSQNEINKRIQQNNNRK